MKLLALFLESLDLLPEVLLVQYQLRVLVSALLQLKVLLLLQLDLQTPDLVILLLKFLYGFLGR